MLLKKELKNSDVGYLGRIVLPRVRLKRLIYATNLFDNFMVNL